MSNLRNITSQDLRSAVGSICYGKAGVGEGTTTAGSIKTTAAVDYTINGRYYTKAAADNVVVGAQPVQAALTSCMYLVTIDAAGTLALVKGAEKAAGSSVFLPENPAPDSRAVLGAVKVTTASATTFTAGTTDLSAAGITAVYFDLSHINAAAY